MKTGDQQRTEEDQILFAGICDICGEGIAYFYDGSRGIIDIYIDSKNEIIYTYVRHYATAPSNADPDCAKYSSPVYQVEMPPKNMEKNE